MIHLECNSATGAWPHIGPAGLFWLGSWCEATGLDTQGRPGAVGVARRAELGLKSFQDECRSFVLSGVPGLGALSRLAAGRRLEQGRLPPQQCFTWGTSQLATHLGRPALTPSPREGWAGSRLTSCGDCGRRQPGHSPPPCLEVSMAVNSRAKPQPRAPETGEYLPPCGRSCPSGHPPQLHRSL